MDQIDTKDYWEAYYKSGGPSTSKSTSFATYCLPYIDVKKVLFDMGCGSGRDALFFLQNHIPVIALDKSIEAVELTKSQADSQAPGMKAKFHAVPAGFETLEKTFNDNNRPFSGTEVGTIYSRFTLHAVDKRLATAMLSWAAGILSVGGLLCIEARSVLSSMYGKGIQCSEDSDAWTNRHYRRFIRRDQLVEELEQLGFTIVCEDERAGVAVFDSDDPVVVRIIARKNHASHKGTEITESFNGFEP